MRVDPVLDPAQLRCADVLIVATKAIDTAATLESICETEIRIALSVQNGISKNELLTASFGAPRVLGAVADISGELTSAGDVAFTRNVNIAIGEVRGGSSDRVAKLVSALNGAGIHATAHSLISTLEWSTFACWVGLMALAITTRAPTWQFLTDPAGAILVVRLAREVALTAEEYGAQMSDESIFPIATLCRCTEREAVAILQRCGNQFRASSPLHRVSALQDLESGRALELEETPGFAVAKARNSSIAVPLLESFHCLAVAIDHFRLGSPPR